MLEVKANGKSMHFSATRDSEQQSDLITNILEQRWDTEHPWKLIFPPKLGKCTKAIF